MIRLLVISTLYPNAVQGRHGIFVETRLRRLIETGHVSATVIAPVPWFPLSDKRFPNYVRSSRIPAKEERHGVTVYHPRYLVIPKVGMLLTPLFLGVSILFQLLRLGSVRREAHAIDAHYFYPDGVAVAAVAWLCSKPFVITARGTDINLIPQLRLPRKMILWAARRAARSVTVCEALKTEMEAIGADASKIDVRRNGVDLELFRPLNRDDSRRELGVSGTTLLSVGHLIERKGHHLVIDAMTELPESTLLIAGDGEWEGRLREQVRALGLEHRVHFLGALTQPQLVTAYNAADIMVLASSREGWANVLLESMACGTPVVATNIWGTPEVVCEAAAGRLVPNRSGQAIAREVTALLQNPPDRCATRQYAEQYSWDSTTQGLVNMFQSLVPENQQELA